jgi:hypothetical protein
MRHIHTGTNILKTAYLGMAVVFLVAGNATAVAAPAVVTVPGNHAFPESIMSTSDWVSGGQLAYLFDPAKKELPPRLPFSIYRVPLSGN